MKEIQDLPIKLFSRKNKVGFVRSFLLNGLTKHLMQLTVPLDLEIKVLEQHENF